MLSLEDVESLNLYKNDIAIGPIKVGQFKNLATDICSNSYQSCVTYASNRNNNLITAGASFE